MRRPTSFGKKMKTVGDEKRCRRDFFGAYLVQKPPELTAYPQNIDKNGKNFLKNSTFLYISRGGAEVFLNFRNFFQNHIDFSKTPWYYYPVIPEGFCARF